MTIFIKTRAFYVSFKVFYAMLVAVAREIDNKTDGVSSACGRPGFPSRNSPIINFFRPRIIGMLLSALLILEFTFEIKFW